MHLTFNLHIYHVNPVNCLLCLKQTAINPTPFVNILIKTKSITESGLMLKRCSECPHQSMSFCFHMTRVHSHLWLAARCKPAHGELVENYSFAASQRGWRAAQRGRDRRPQWASTKAAMPITGPRAVSYQHSFYGARIRQQRGTMCPFITITVC